MEELPTTEQPIQYAAYPRGLAFYGTPEKLRSVADAYYGLSTLGLVGILTSLICAGLASTSALPSGLLLAAVFLTNGILMACLSYPYLKKLQFGCDWRPSTPVIVAVLMGITSTFCFGVLFCAIVQSCATQEIRSYGIHHGMMGIPRREIDKKISDLKEAHAFATLRRLPTGD